MSEKKWREFWILKTPGGEFIQYEEPMGYDWSRCKKMRVIEYGAAEELTSQLAARDEEIARLKLAESSTILLKQAAKINELREKVRGLVEALKEIKDKKAWRSVGHHCDSRQQLESCVFKAAFALKKYGGEGE